MKLLLGVPKNKAKNQVFLLYTNFFVLKNKKRICDFCFLFRKSFDSENKTNKIIINKCDSTQERPEGGLALLGIFEKSLVPDEDVNADKRAESTGSIHDGQVKERNNQSSMQ